MKCPRYSFTLAGCALEALGSGALFWPDQGCLIVSDLHLGKAERMAHGGAYRPPQDTRDTLLRLETDMIATGAEQVICLGDSFDDVVRIGGLSEQEHLWLARLQAGRSWHWIAGHHAPAPVALGGAHHNAMHIGPLALRHQADADFTAPAMTSDGVTAGGVPGKISGEISGHYHPQARVGFSQTSEETQTKPCFLIDAARVILPAYGTYAGGLYRCDAIFESLLAKDRVTVLTGPVAQALPQGA